MTVTVPSTPTERTLEEARDLIYPTDPKQFREVIDAIRSVSYFATDQPHWTPVFPVGRATDGSLHVTGHYRFWTESEVLAVLDATFRTPASSLDPDTDLPDLISNLVGLYRTNPLDEEDDLLFYAIGFLVWGGVTMADAIGWSLHDPEATNGDGLGWRCPTYWVARWGKDSLAALVDAGFTYAELGHIYETGDLPDAAAVATIAALRHP